MDINHIKRKVTGFLCCLFFLVSCIENDIPYPYREGSITDFLVEGQLDNTLEIDKTKGMVTVEVSDAVDLAALRIKKLTVTNEAEVRIDSAACLDYNAFPRIGFSSLDSLPKSADTRVDFSSSVSLILQTYQEYPWKITVNQTIDRTVQVSNQVGEPVIDLANREMIVYVAKEQHLDRITVTKMQLGGSVGIVVPDPTTVTNFSRPCSFEVTRFGVTETWKVTILHTEGGAVSGGETVAMANRIIVTGMIQEGKIPVIEYREKNPSQTRVDDGWQTLPASSVTVNGTSFTATITGLNPGTTYVYRVVIDDIAGEEVECKTAIVEEKPAASLWKRRQFVRSVVAQFCYCAAQTGIFGFFINYVTEMDPGISNLRASRILAFGGMALFMIGRLSGSFTMKWLAPGRLLTWYSLLSAVCMALVVASVGTLSLYALYLSFFFMSIMFPTIFALGLEGMGVYTKKASSYIVMGVAGGAFSPMLMGYIGEENMALGFIVPLIAFLYILYFAIKCKR